MEPVVGLDVSKGISTLQAFIHRNESYGKLVTILHTREGLEQLHHLLLTLKERAGADPIVILEATGHYHRGLTAFLDRNEHRYIMVNPLQSKRAKNTKLRKVKTDATDAWHLAEMYYREEVMPHREQNEPLIELQHLTRQHEFITSLYVQAKLNTQALLDQVFPTFTQVFCDVYSKSSLFVLQQCLNQPDQPEDAIRKIPGRSHGEAWIQKKIDLLTNAIKQNPIEHPSKTLVVAVRSMVVLLLQFQEQLSVLEQQIEETTVVLPEVALLKTISGIGDKLSDTIAAEFGDVTQFRHAKQLIAYAGLDPSVFSSGKFTASSNRITKRGSKRLRRAMYLAVLCGLRGNNTRIQEFYEKKKKEGKPYKVAVIACANKLLHHIHAILVKGQPYCLS
ncbi:IS110 family transposase [Paenibacillus sp. OSY-SE]|uniref:IS110 family transposase n=1 Tax=Paenibacillus sp. OSY-SE TaxID=1196323 RepID=UPI000315DBA3|nr:IS110 family transposase [Paenibacillus sp. OSY-SE]